MLKYLYGAKTPDAKGRKMVEVDLVEKMFNNGESFIKALYGLEEN